MQDLRKTKNQKVYTDHLPNTNYKGLLKKSIWVIIPIVLIVVAIFPFEIGYLIGKWWSLFNQGFSNK